MNQLIVQEFVQHQDPRLGLKLIAGQKGLHKRITHALIQKMGLAFTGFIQTINPERLQVIGNTEMTYLKTLTLQEQEKVLRQICSLPLSCLVVTQGLEIPELLLREADEKEIPLFQTHLSSFDFIERVNQLLETKLSPTTSLHGVLLDIFGVGALIMGKSGIGKSECALDLIRRGHRLVADDMVHIQRYATALIGSGFDVIKHHMEIRGLGIINIRSLFGVEAIRENKKIELVIELTDWESHQEYDRLGLDGASFSILEIELPMLRIPVTPARNLSTIIEVAVRNHLLKIRGYNSAVEFDKELQHRINEGTGEIFETEGEVE